MQADIDKLSNRIAKKRLIDRDKINQAIGRLKERYPRVARYFDLAYDPMTQVLISEFNAEKQDKAAQLDGCYVLKTSRNDLSADELWRIYALLTRAEDAFRDMKTPLAERPIFHHLERRVDSHVLVYSSYCSMFRRVEDGPRHDARRLGIGTPVAFDDIDALRNAIVPTVSLSA